MLVHGHALPAGRNSMIPLPRINKHRRTAMQYAEAWRCDAAWLLSLAVAAWGEPDFVPRRLLLLRGGRDRLHMRGEVRQYGVLDDGCVPALQPLP
ncbi:MAG: hypothetical protein J6P53_04940 [Mailhella sp.]|nr:hypothetical protein [Mailhella sp.]